MSLSVCLLTRNEEQTLARAVHSVAGLADEVVVADTGSTDRTAALAAELGAKVCRYPWDDDFSAGRNFTIDQAAGDWILWLNASEELLPDSHSPARAGMARMNVFGYFVQIQSGEGPARPLTETSDLRLFRKRPDLHFVGRLHPHFDPALVETIQRQGMQVLPSAITLRTTPSPDEGSEAKLRWTARLLELELRERPGQLHYSIEYGRTLLHLKEPKGHAVLAEAADQVLAARDASAAPAMKVQVLLEYVLTTPLQDYRGRLSRDQANELALRWFPVSPPLLYRCAEHCFHKGEYRKAAEVLERLVVLGRTGGYEKSRSFDPGLVGDDALINLAACCRQLGEWDRAEISYRQLLSSKHFSAQAALGLAEVQRRRPRGRHRPS